MFGMTRTTLAWGKAASTVSVPMPAMMVTTSVPGAMKSRYTGAASGKLWGFTAMTTVSASRIASGAEGTAPYIAWTSPVLLGLRGFTTRMSPPGTPCRTRPPIMARAMRVSSAFCT